MSQSDSGASRPAPAPTQGTRECTCGHRRGEHRPDDGPDVWYECSVAGCPCKAFVSRASLSPETPRSEFLENAIKTLVGAEPARETTRDGWICDVPRSHGPCNKLNDAADESCEACGNDRPGSFHEKALAAREAHASPTGCSWCSRNSGTLRDGKHWHPCYTCSGTGETSVKCLNLSAAGATTPRTPEPQPVILWALFDSRGIMVEWSGLEQEMHHAAYLATEGDRPFGPFRIAALVERKEPS